MSSRELLAVRNGDWDLRRALYTARGAGTRLAGGVVYATELDALCTCDQIKRRAGMRARLEWSRTRFHA